MKRIHGTFHIPGKSSQKFGGTIDRVRGELVLEVVGWDTWSRSHDVIVGLLADGSAATLVEVRKTKMRMGVHGPRPRFRVWHLLIGRSYRRMADIAFNTASASFTDLSAWWSWHTGFMFSDGQGSERPFTLNEPSIRMRYDRAPTLKAVLPDVVIEAGPMEAQHLDSRRYRIKTTARVSFAWSSRQSMKRMYSDLDAMEALLWTVLDQPSLTRSIVAQDKRFKARVFEGKSKFVQPIEIRTMLRTPRPLPRPFALFPRPDEVAPLFEALCRGWFALWASERTTLAALAEADTESSRSAMVTPPVQRTWYMAHAKSLDAIWMLAHPGHKGKMEHIEVLTDVFASHGPLLFPDPVKAPQWKELAIEMYNIRNDAGHGKVKARRALSAREVGRGQDLTVSLGRILLLELAGLPRATAVDWVTRGSRWSSFAQGQRAGGAL